MVVHVTPDEVRRRIAADPDKHAEDFLPEDSLARAKYHQGVAFVDRPHAPADADPEELRSYGLTPEQWSEQMEAALIALRHDMKLDMLRQGIGRV